MIMKKAIFIPSMRYLSYWIMPNQFGDTNVSTNCENIAEAKQIIGKTEIE